MDASALPVIGVGIVLSGVPDALATWTWLGALSIVVALAFLQRALVHFWTTAQTRSVPPAIQLRYRISGAGLAETSQEGESGQARAGV